jgi:hypothetical protein
VFEFIHASCALPLEDIELKYLVLKLAVTVL